MDRLRRRVWIGLAMVWLATGEVSAQVTAKADLTELSLEELMAIEVTLPSRRAEPRALASSPIYVITQEDIRRSGFNSIPDALRLAPGMQVARINSNQWAVGVRGFGNRLSRNVLALMDGRSLYTPLFAGTYWEVQDTVLDDIERIEIVRGPGGALWGSNAVNGVINIVTKSAADTHGLLVSGGGGSEERGFGTVRYGGQYGDKLHYRMYGKYFDRASFPNAGGKQFDGWSMGQGGFRIDSDGYDADRFTLQGDIYDGKLGQSVPITHYQPPFSTTVQNDADVSGANLLGRWTHDLGVGSQFVLQSYYDHTFRREANFTEERNTFDLDVQHQFPLFWDQQIVWGVDYRFSHDSTQAAPTIVFAPPSKSLNLVSMFVQDDVWLLPDQLRLTVGSKFEYTTYSDFEVQPSGSLLWLPAAGHSLWASISRAVRTPSRVEHDLTITAGPANALPPQNDVCIVPASGMPSPCVYTRVGRNRDFEAEDLAAYQIGYRAQPVGQLFLDVAGFYNQHDNFFSVGSQSLFVETDPSPAHVVLPFIYANDLHGESYGFEIAATVQPLDRWRLTASYSYLEIHLRQDAGTLGPPNQDQTFENASPTNQVALQSKLDLPWQMQLDSTFRYVDVIRTAGQLIPSYVTGDLRLAKELGGGVEIAAVGQNLWQPQHREFAPGTEVPRGAYGEIRWEW